MGYILFTLLVFCSPHHGSADQVPEHVKRGRPCQTGLTPDTLLAGLFFNFFFYHAADTPLINVDKSVASAPTGLLVLFPSASIPPRPRLNTRPYAFPLLFPFFVPLAATSVPLAISELAAAAADSASSISGVYGLPSVLAAAAAGGRRLGSSLPTAGIDVASMVWKGAGTKWPAASNHSAKERVTVKVAGEAGLEDWAGSMVMVSVYSGTFLRVEVAIVICAEGRPCQLSVSLAVCSTERGGELCLRSPRWARCRRRRRPSPSSISTASRRS